MLMRLGLILGIGCRPTIKMKITVPAKVRIDPVVTSIAVVDRVNNTHTHNVISGFIESSQKAKTVRFQVIDAQQIYNDLAVPVNGPIPVDDLALLCERTNVKGTLVLDRFTHEKSTEVNEKPTSAPTADDKPVEPSLFTASYSSTMQISWRLRGCTGETYDRFGEQISDSKSADGRTPGDATAALGSLDDYDDVLAKDLGRQYFNRISPHEKWIQRTPYLGKIGSEGADFRQAVALMKTGDWFQAEEKYLSILQGIDPEKASKLLGKGYYNLAIVYENLGDYEKMWDAVCMAHKYLNSVKSEKYYTIAKETKLAGESLEDQMQNAIQENPQENQ